MHSDTYRPILFFLTAQSIYSLWIYHKFFTQCPIDNIWGVFDLPRLANTALMIILGCIFFSGPETRVEAGYLSGRERTKHRVCPSSVLANTLKLLPNCDCTNSQPSQKGMSSCLFKISTLNNRQLSRWLKVSQSDIYYFIFAFSWLPVR